MSEKNPGASIPVEKIVLALDTSTDMLACAVARVAAEGRVTVLAARDHLCRRQANVELVGTARQALADAGLSMADVDAVLTGRGPGSFTGVRIGVATAKGLACGLGRPLFGASALDAMAWAAHAAGVRGTLAVAGDAMRGEVYPGIYRLDDAGAHRTFAAETVVKADACVAAWAERADAAELTLTGNGLAKYRARFEAAGFSHFSPEEAWYPTGEGLLRAAAEAGVFSGPAAQSGDPALVLPIYTRLSDAEEAERTRLGLKAPATVELTGVDDALAGIHLQLRPMTVNDTSAVAALEAAAYEGSAHTPWSERLFYEELTQPGRSWWVAHDQGQIIGFAGGVLAGADFEVEEVVVDAARRREGIARRLVARVAYDAQMLGAHTLSLEVDAQNDPARALYAALGLAEEGRRPGYYPAGAGESAHDALILRAPLPLAADAVGGGDDHPEPAPSIRPWPIECAPRGAEAEAAIAAAGPLVLTIESSCDETAMAVTDSHGVVCANVVATQIDFHARFGGVVPEIASRKHTEAIVGVFEETLARAGEHFGVDTLTPADLAAVGCTAGPGLVGALVVGVAFAKGLCAAADLPLIAVHHLEGHLMANLFETPDLEPPFVASIVSGGNTMLVHVRAWGDYVPLGATIDDAVGEAFDKVAKALGLGYPGGPVISKLSAQGNPRAMHFPRAMMHSGDYSFSLSGLKTAVITYIEGENRAGRAINLPDLAASFEAAVIDVQVAKAVTAVEETGVSDFCVGGGVAANPGLRAAYKAALEKRGVRVTVPPMRACGDNAAMIGIAALRSFRAGSFSPLTLDADPNAPLGTWSTPDAPVPPVWTVQK
ncbi:tRNA (adenosine(37)-N6)-threonylcarbamoyltransferase complex transferase subunit TsaD [Thermophilibacter provencensis]|uniref:tRNA N6-adenosine threonylcarbamoyltransferase n=1 Tax=Thermophilibacter provencensis TaxID=1852386 RepID=A0A921GEN3_9ACTN|nr:tRNA (adenosine(37)-N6)-threonylcarbamoyltransferase complex transferase subunit TsaD [Thermophilibacter provencensis]HJF45375.1 tRNA (adenosine(37)-N6)-threonylcarbamoyltransferase complex transferase subunit TsaD [Thermophilibacter provencensis]